MKIGNTGSNYPVNANNEISRKKGTVSSLRKDPDQTVRSLGTALHQHK